MYSIKVPYKNFKDQPRNGVADFNLTIPECIKLAGPFQALFKRMNDDGPERELKDEEKLEFYDALETVLLSAWGEPSADGEHFRKAGRYDFQESAMFPAVMVQLASDPRQAVKFIESVMPTEELKDLIKNAEVNLNSIENAPESTDELKAEIARLKAQLPVAEVAAPVAPAN